MSLRNGASKHSHHDSKRSSGSRSSLASKQQNNSSGSRSSPSHQPRRQPSLSMHLTDSTAARASSPRVSQPSNATPMLDSTSDTSQTLNTDMSYLLAYTQIDLLEVSAWAYPQQSPHQYQDFSHQSYDSTQTSSCPYHTSEIRSGHHAAWCAYGLAPLERWLDEDVVDGGAVAFQLGHQLRVDCTCMATQGGMGMDAVNGTQHGVTSDN